MNKEDFTSLLLQITSTILMKFVIVYSWKNLLLPKTQIKTLSSKISFKPNNQKLKTLKRMNATSRISMVPLIVLILSKMWLILIINSTTSNPHQKKVHSSKNYQTLIQAPLKKNNYNNNNVNRNNNLFKTIVN